MGVNGGYSITRLSTILISAVEKALARPSIGCSLSSRFFFLTVLPFLIWVAFESLQISSSSASLASMLLRILFYFMSLLLFWANALSYSLIVGSYSTKTKRSTPQTRRKMLKTTPGKKEMFLTITYTTYLKRARMLSLMCCLKKKRKQSKKNLKHSLKKVAKTWSKREFSVTSKLKKLRKKKFAKIQKQLKLKKAKPLRKRISMIKNNQ
jgi:hypothetical protein